MMPPLLRPGDKSGSFLCAQTRQGYPVACLILKVMLEDIPRHGPELADELRRVGAEIKEKAENVRRSSFSHDE